MQFGIKHGLVAVTVFLFLWVPLKPQVKLVTEQYRRMARAGEALPTTPTACSPTIICERYLWPQSNPLKPTRQRRVTYWVIIVPICKSSLFLLLCTGEEFFNFVGGGNVKLVASAMPPFGLESSSAGVGGRPSRGPRGFHRLHVPCVARWRRFSSSSFPRVEIHYVLPKWCLYLHAILVLMGSFGGPHRRMVVVTALLPLGCFGRLGVVRKRCRIVPGMSHGRLLLEDSMTTFVAGHSRLLWNCQPRRLAQAQAPLGLPVACCFMGAVVTPGKFLQLSTS